MSPEQPGRPEEPREESLLPAVPDALDGGDPAAPVEEVLGDADTAAAAALARAREAARAKGLRPGSRPVKRRRPQAGAFSSSGRDGRDPRCSATRWTGCSLDRGWKVDVAVGSVMGRWPQIVGTDVAAHCHPGELRRRRPHRPGRLHRLGHPGAAAVLLDPGSARARRSARRPSSELRVNGPGAPSWSSGSRRARAPARATPTADRRLRPRRTRCRGTTEQAPATPPYGGPRQPAATARSGRGCGRRRERRTRAAGDPGRVGGLGTGPDFAGKWRCGPS